MKFVTPLNEATCKELRRIIRDEPSYHSRRRAHAILLSNKRYTLENLADIFECDRDTVSAWITEWENHAFDGLQDAPRSGRPPITTAKQDRMILRTVERHPQQTTTAQAVLEKKAFC